MAQRRRPRTSDEVRQAFVDFFRSKDHLERPSASLIPVSTDPTVLLTTAGMQPMISFMLGRAAPPAPRMVSVQKCFRTTDIDAVGNPRNLTFFEMLGNFSIGDYFKPEAIAWAWEFVTLWLRLPPERVWSTVHPTDDEAVQLWLGQGVPAERIVRLEENWWGPPGAEGPCGPDSELYYDRGEAFGCGQTVCAPGCDCDRFLEFWNLVFMQYFQDRAGVRTPLPRPNIDTGMGLERTTCLMQDVPSVYETDLFRPIMDAVGDLAGTSYGRDEATDYALRVLADHGRAMTFLATDGVVPSNEGRGYVMRRVIRRAVRFGRVLGVEGSFLRGLAERVIGRMGSRYPDLRTSRETIFDVLESEERRFRETLAGGETRLSEWMEAAKSRGEQRIDGQLLFLLHDTFGFPFELSEEILAEQGFAADRAGFERAMAEQRQRSRRLTGLAPAVAVERASLDRALPSTEFVGYELLSAPAEILDLRNPEGAPTRELEEGGAGVLILDRTPFYPVGGGQVADRGVIQLPDGLFRVEAVEQDEAGHILHRGEVVAGAFRPGAVVDTQVDVAWRRETTRHHTLTHMLHQTLREVLGATTRQQGSSVEPGVARFDFNYPQPLSPGQLREIQDRINERVLADLQVSWRYMPLEEARESGALMMFGEKYGDIVRVVEIGDFSRELCGGTHVHHSAVVGPAMIRRETGIGSGLRRVEVVAGQEGLQYIRRLIDDFHDLAVRLNVRPGEAPRKVDELVRELEEAQREIQRLSSRLAARQAEELTAGVRQVDGVNVLAARVEAPSVAGLTEQWDALRDKLKSAVVFLGSVADGKANLLVGVTEDLRARGLDAGALMVRFAPLAGGKGGGKPPLAKGTSPDPARLGAALEAAPSLVREALQER